MKKKLIIIVSAIVLVIAIAVAAIFIVKGSKYAGTNNSEQTNSSSDNFEIYGNDNDVEDIWDVM